MKSPVLPVALAVALASQSLGHVHAEFESIDSFLKCLNAGRRGNQAASGRQELLGPGSEGIKIQTWSVPNSGALGGVTQTCGPAIERWADYSDYATESTGQATEWNSPAAFGSEIDEFGSLPGIDIQGTSVSFHFVTYTSGLSHTYATQDFYSEEDGKESVGVILSAEQDITDRIYPLPLVLSTAVTPSGRTGREILLQQLPQIIKRYSESVNMTFTGDSHDFDPEDPSKGIPKSRSRNNAVLVPYNATLQVSRLLCDLLEPLPPGDHTLIPCKGMFAAEYQQTFLINNEGKPVEVTVELGRTTVLVDAAGATTTNGSDASVEAWLRQDAALILRLIQQRVENAGAASSEMAKTAQSATQVTFPVPEANDTLEFALTVIGASEVLLAVAALLCSTLWKLHSGNIDWESDLFPSFGRLALSATALGAGLVPVYIGAGKEEEASHWTGVDFFSGSILSPLCVDEPPGGTTATPRWCIQPASAMGALLVRQYETTLEGRYATAKWTLTALAAFLLVAHFIAEMMRCGAAEKVRPVLSSTKAKLTTTAMAAKARVESISARVGQGMVQLAPRA